MAETIVTERPHYCIAKVWHGEDWFDPLPQLVDGAGAAFDLTDLADYSFELFIRPSFDHTVSLRRLTSVGSDGILIDNAALGLVSIFLPKTDVEADLPISDGRNGWDQFLRLNWTDPILGAVSKIIWEGPCFVYPARDTL